MGKDTYNSHPGPRYFGNRGIREAQHVAQPQKGLNNGPAYGRPIHYRKGGKSNAVYSDYNAARRRK